MVPSIVVWWTIDSLRRDVCSVYGGEAVTPGLSELAARGRAFDGRSSATWTLPSVTSILTGQPPEEHGVVDDTDRLPPGVATLPQQFRYEGWRTIGVVANPWFTRRSGLDIGFDSFYNITEDRSILREAPLSAVLRYLLSVGRLNGGLTTDQSRHPTEPLMAAVASDRIEQTDVPVFMMVHTQGAHSPYHPPPSWDRHSGSSDPRRDAYLNLVEFVDAQVGRFLKQLPDDALVIATSDHGEALGESGKWGHKAPELEVLYDVPLVINRAVTDLPDPLTHVEVNRWLRDEIAPKAEPSDRSDAIQQQLAALGYVDGEHSA